MPAFTVIVMAAGQGTRMKSDLPKVLHPLCGRPLVNWPVEAALAAGAGKVVVVGGPDRALESALPPAVELAVQEEARGTGDAVKAAGAHIADDETVVVLSGDVPLITADAIAALVAAHESAGAQATMATMVLDDPGSYGRVVRDADGNVARVAEAKGDGDATPEELAIDEVNTGVYAFSGGPLLAALDRLDAGNAQGEYYLPGVLDHLDPVAAHVVDDPTLTLGVNDRADLARIEPLAQRRINDAHRRNGATIHEPAHIDASVTIGHDATIEPGSVLRGSTSVGDRATIGPNTTLVDTTIGEDTKILHAYATQATTEAGVSVGPFAYLRPGTVLRRGAKVGTFVEVKNSDIGEGAKVPHLSYLGDADVGAGANVGAANVTANYDGKNKHRTTIGTNVRTGVDTTFVAPVTVGDNALTAAGSVITEDVPEDALGVARARQTNVEGYAKRTGDDA